ncbi:MAG: GIY-YIG nuclease family protein [Chloroflexi bacterium]|nr:MAG: GIY-YIG nuclease family protein [Chloroflexota bacterium]
MLERPLSLDVGRLGRVTLPAARLVYVGSARGSGGLKARVRRHLLREKRVRWHVDALSSRVQPRAWLADARGVATECGWAKRLADHPQSWIPVLGFGSSDCGQGCPAHLIALPLHGGPSPLTLLAPTGEELVYYAEIV